LKQTAFGATDLRVSEYGIGCARIGGVFQQEPAQFIDLLARARDAGINFFDTADMYSQGESEKLLGRAFRGVRDRVVLASKVGYRLPAQRRLAGRIKPILRPLVRLLGIRRDRLPSLARGTIDQEFTGTYLKGAVEASLRRLRTDHLDLLQLHSPPAEVVARGEWERALEDMKRAGKVRYYGVACDTEAAGQAALRFAGVSSLQITMNLLEHAAADGLLPEARSRGVAFIARECLANGILAKREADLDLGVYCKTPEELGRRADQLTQLRRQASDRGVSLTRAALEFVSRTEGVSVTLLGVRTVAQLQGLLAEAGR
jgi:aryl-alcohol dehydrogenase-like predicted oxidoreductase